MSTFHSSKKLNKFKTSLPKKGAFTIETEPDFPKLHTLCIASGKRGGGKSTSGIPTTIKRRGEERRGEARRGEERRGRERGGVPWECKEAQWRAEEGRGGKEGVR